MADLRSGSESSPLYHAVPPIASTIVKVTGVLTVVLVVLSFIICLVKGSSNHTFYLLACNLIISSIIAITTAWWYRESDLVGTFIESLIYLHAEKYWYVILVGVVIIFQCLTTNVYIFSVKH